MSTLERRYDIDWVRVIAIGLLLIYHIAIGFQAWGIMIGFIANDKTWESLWIPMSMLNIWRIPLLFFVSGMGVYFALQNRNWKQLLRERSGRILLPYVFGAIAIVPIHQYLWKYYYQMPQSYTPNPAHLWFLGNIFSYVLIFTPLFFYIKNHEEGKLARAIKWSMRNPFGLIIMVGIFIIQALIIKPVPYEMYAMTWHGYFLGLTAFFFGFCFVLAGKPFWNMITRGRWIVLFIAVALYIVRMYYFRFGTPLYLLVIESNGWILTVLAFASKYLNRPSRVLRYLSEAAYPIYIIHMIILYAGSFLIFKLNVDVRIQFVLSVISTFAGCFLVYEFVIRRIKFLRPLFGLRFRESNVTGSPITQVQTAPAAIGSEP